jgi:hypothetical protein
MDEELGYLVYLFLYLLTGKGFEAPLELEINIDV